MNSKLEIGSMTQKLEKLAVENSLPCVTISMNTTRNNSNGNHDSLTIKNLLKEAEKILDNEFDKKSIAPLIDKLGQIALEIDFSSNQDSLHLFISNYTLETIKSIWPVNENTVHVSETFDIKPLIKLVNRNEEFLILLLAQHGAHLYQALNDRIISEIENDDFPFLMEQSDSNQSKNPQKTENLAREFLNKVDKALIKVYNQTGLQCVVLASALNQTRLQQAADRISIYVGFERIDENRLERNQLEKQGWEIIKTVQQKRRLEAIEEIQEESGRGQVLTDMQVIYQAALDGRGDLLIIDQNFSQPVLMLSDRTFELVQDRLQLNVKDDIVSEIAWEVLSKKGRVVFTEPGLIESFGKMVLKTRY